MSMGLAVGKFYPPHIGHHHLIDVAESETTLLIVAVCYSSVENIPVLDRIAWLEDRHPNVRFIPIKDDTPVLYTDETWGHFLDALMSGLDTMGLYPTVVYSGEDYADEFAERLTERYKQGATSSAVKEPVTARQLDRGAVVDFSASRFRAHPDEYWDYLAPATKAGLCKRVVICGAESTGTTTLAKALAEYYETTVVPEYGRHFDWAVGKHHEWKHEDFLHIAAMQKQWEDSLARESRKGLLICDTDEFATAMFHEVYLDGAKAPDILDLADDSPANLYIVTDHVGVDFEDDGTRFNSGRRAWQTEWLKKNVPCVMVTGDHETRMRQAREYIDGILHWHIEDPIEYRTLEA